jgi:hypothetical protein
MSPQTLIVMTKHELQALIPKITSKRARTLLEHVLKHGQITTEELKTTYGYDHPPRAAKDVTDRGIPLERVRVPGPNGRSITAYRLGDLSGSAGVAAGRTGLPKILKDALIHKYGEYCANCNGHFSGGRGLQVDHRVPYHVGGDPPFSDVDKFMLLCGSCNRSKSFTCEGCPNWVKREPTICDGCLWASPETYSHIATENRRQLTITWTGSDTIEFDDFEKRASHRGLTPAEAARDALRRSRD